MQDFESVKKPVWFGIETIVNRSTEPVWFDSGEAIEVWFGFLQLFL